MSGRTHETRTPHKMNEALGRDVLGFVARQTKATQDLRKVIYVGPFGKGFHKVRNPVSNEEYVVADGLGGTTMRPGSVAGVMSFSGQHGEVLAVRSPLGFATASSGGFGTSVTGIPSSPTQLPLGPLLWSRTFYVDMCYNRDSDKAYIAAFETSDVNGIPVYRIAFIRVAKINIPHSTQAVETIIGSISVESGEYVASMGMFYLGSGAFVFAFVSNHDPLLEGDRRVRMVKVNGSSGTVLADTSYPITGGYDSWGTGSLEFVKMNFAVISGYLYSIESVKVTTVCGGIPPAHNNRRLVKRSLSTLEEIADEAFPDPIVTDRYYTVPGLLTPEFAYSFRMGTNSQFVAYLSQGYSSAPSLDGTINSGTISATYEGVRNGDAYVSAGVILQLTMSKLFSWAGDVTDDVGFTTIYNGAAFDMGLFIYDDLTDNSVVLLGDGTTWITSIVSSAGQQLPPEP